MPHPSRTSIRSPTSSSPASVSARESAMRIATLWTKRSVQHPISILLAKPVLRRCSRSARPNLLDHRSLPLSAPEQQHAGDRQRRLRDWDRSENAIDSESCPKREHPCQRYLKHPKAHKVEERGRVRIARAVESLPHHHSPSVKDVPVRNRSQRGGSHLHHSRIIRENPDELLRKPDENHGDTTKEDHVVESREEHRFLGAVGFMRAQVLPHERRRGIGHAPAWQEREENHPQSQRVAGNRHASENGAH